MEDKPLLEQGKPSDALPSQDHYCFGCGILNKKGLQLQFRVEGARVSAGFVPGPEHQGFPNAVHGGIVSALLDEAMAWVLYGNGIFAVTGKLTVSFRQPLAPGVPVSLIGQLVKDRGSFLEVASEIRQLDGTVIAQGQGIYRRMPEEQANQLLSYYHGTGQTRLAASHSHERGSQNGV